MGLFASFRRGQRMGPSTNTREVARNSRGYPWYVLSSVPRVASLHTLQLLDVIKGLLYLHDGDIVHGDLNGVCIKHSSCSLTNHQFIPQLNVLVSNNRKALISDFGKSNIERVESRMQTVDFHTLLPSVPALSLRWAAPEIFDSSRDFGNPGQNDADEDGVKRPTKSSDIWSFGCLIYEVCVGCILRP